ncbi:MAG: glycosyltransferase family 9 protein [Lentisphaeria bacterium]|nr:glycosyltransferase family 9 protein [Lentisphaeria bacterium]
MAERFLAIKPSSFGDIIHLFPALDVLKKAFPDAVLDFVVNPEFAPLLEFSPFPVENIICFERRKLAEFPGCVPEFFKLRSRLRREKYDAVIDFQGLFRSGVCSFMTGSRLRCGFAHPREAAAAWFYNRKVALEPMHAVERCVRLVEGIFSLERCENIVYPELPVSSAGKAGLPQLPEKYMVLLPGTRWESKQFPPALFAGVIREMKKIFPEMGFVIAGGKGERALGDVIGTGSINLAGKTSLPALFELLRGAEAVLGNDSGPLHAAAALRRPVFGFYGPTEPGLTGPWGEDSMPLSNHAECAGCLKRVCPLEKVLCHDITPETVVEKICRKLQQ